MRVVLVVLLSRLGEVLEVLSRLSVVLVVRVVVVCHVGECVFCECMRVVCELFAFVCFVVGLLKIKTIIFQIYNYNKTLK